MLKLKCYFFALHTVCLHIYQKHFTEQQFSLTFYVWNTRFKRLSLPNRLSPYRTYKVDN